MIKNYIEVFDWHDSLFDLFRRKINNVSNSLPNFVNILSLINVKHASIRANFLPNLVIEFDSSFLKQKFEWCWEYIIIGSRWTINQPGNTLKTDSNINDLNGKFLSFSFVVVFVLHEHHIT